MLVALAGLLSGYNGHFDFTSGATYPEDVPYVAMRVMLATFGVALVPLAWYTAVELGMSWRACHLTALMVLLGAYPVDACNIRPNLCCRCWLALHITIHPSGCHAPFLHFHHGLLSREIPQPAISVRPLLSVAGWYCAKSNSGIDHFHSTGGYGSR